MVKSRGCELLAGRGRREVIGSVSGVRGERAGSLGVSGVWESPGPGALREAGRETVDRAGRKVQGGEAHEEVGARRGSGAQGRDERGENTGRGAGEADARVRECELLSLGLCPLCSFSLPLCAPVPGTPEGA